jgi:hypothetical protein
MDPARNARIHIARTITSMALPDWARNPQLQADLRQFVETGSPDAIRDSRIRGLVEYVRRLPPDQPPDEGQVRQILAGIAPIAGDFIRDERARDFVQDTLTDPNLPIHGDEAQRRAYTAQRVQDFIGPTLANMPPEMQRFYELYIAAMPYDKGRDRRRFLEDSIANLPPTDPTRRMVEAYVHHGMPEPARTPAFRKYTEALLRISRPYDTPQQIRAQTEQIWQYLPERSRGPLDLLGLIPEGCMIPLALLFLFGCMGTVLVGMLITLGGLTAFQNTSVGQAAVATLMVFSIGGGLIAWVRRQTESVWRMVVLGLLLTACLSVGLLVFQGDTSALTDFADAAPEERQRLISAGLLVASIGLTVFFWLRHMVTTIIQLGILLIFVAGAVLFAIHSDLIDFDSLRGEAMDTISGP